MSENPTIRSDSSMSWRKDIVTGAITGKYSALHAYDRMIWTIRSGYLTLLFGGWALVLKSTFDAAAPLYELRTRFAVFYSAMIVVSLGLMSGAFIVDHSYLRAKFLVIASLNKLLPRAVNLKNIENLAPDELSGILEEMRVAGHSSDLSYRIKGYNQAAFDEYALYSISLLAVLIAGATCFFFL